MSNPSDVPPPEHSGTHPAPARNAPPAGSELPGVNPQIPPGYQPPGQGAPAGRAPAGRARFEMPADRPRSFSDAMPHGGFSGMFSVTAMPTELKVSYWIWLIGGLLGLLGGVIGLFGSFVIFAFAPAVGLLVLLLVLVALTLAAAQIILAMKMKEGREWARFALTIVAGISLVLAIVNASAVAGRGGGSMPSFVISLVATVLMWLPNSQAWFAGHRGRI